MSIGKWGKIMILTPPHIFLNTSLERKEQTFKALKKIDNTSRSKIIHIQVFFNLNSASIPTESSS